MFHATFLYLFLSDWYNWQDHIEQRPQPTILKLKRALQDFPFADQIRTTKSFDKDGSVSVNGKFDSPLSPLQIADTFKTLMPQAGWHLEQEKAGQNVSLKFCRDGIAAGIRLVAAATGTQANVHLSWTYQTRSSDYCEVKALAIGKS
jgi:hypothetical protein